ncbi:MAG: radical SAM protein [Thermoplasmatota archaeon]
MSAMCSPTSFNELPSGSFCTGTLPAGCQHCLTGAKMVLLVTGRCPAGCFYCPLSAKKRNRDVVYANERRVHGDEDILAEAEAIEASGTGITGGEPLLELDRTARYIRLLKQHFGSAHHVHLYTARMGPRAIQQLVDEGLDEIRLHPPVSTWDSIADTALADIAGSLSIPVGIEIPVLPGVQAETRQLLETAAGYDIDFVNLNELEFSPTNYIALEQHGYRIKSDTSNAVDGSENMAYEIRRWNLPVPVHYCSSSFKDAVQLRRRLARRARNTARLYDEITDDGTLRKGVIEADRAALPELRQRYDIEAGMMAWDEEKGRVETAPSVAAWLAGRVPYRCFIVEEYPTADRLEVEREPL